jgi:hypothetical protein
MGETMSAESGAEALTGAGRRRRAGTILLSWAAMVGMDLGLHAGLLAPLYRWDGTFLLPPEQAFIRIPVGYGSLLVLAVGMAWLLERLDVTSAWRGALVAGSVGAVGAASLLLGLWTISTADPALLAGWWLAQTAELAVCGAIIGSVRGGTSLRTVVGRVAVLVAVAVLSAVALQTIGYASAAARLR